MPVFVTLGTSPLPEEHPVIVVALDVPDSYPRFGMFTCYQCGGLQMKYSSYRPGRTCCEEWMQCVHGCDPFPEHRQAAP